MLWGFESVLSGPMLIHARSDFNGFSPVQNLIHQIEGASQCRTPFPKREKYSLQDTSAGNSLLKLQVHI